MSDNLEFLKKVQKNKSRKKYRSGNNLALWIASISFCVIIISVILGTIALGIIRNRRYWSYIEDFSASTKYAYEKGNLQVTDQGDNYLLIGESVYLPYNVLQNLKMGRSWNEVPEDSETIFFDFGDGSSLQIWDAEVKNAKRGSRGLYVKFINLEGKIYQFDVDGASIAKIRSVLDRKKGQFKINTFMND